MSYNIQSALGSLALNNYLSLAIVTAVVYDYSEWIVWEHSVFMTIATLNPVLTFSKEIEYIWVRNCPLSSKYNGPNAFTVQTLDLGFHDVRYIGLCWIMTGALSTFKGTK
ncbi:hypothetical protein L210DRAFT_1061587 [Boletus edulis BED1]|uniref:Uncharacterized protein n=1 Tax=Boletus edulis BED1 TaxID=1328754 RepID=A0AAD4GEY8_BOLED|nr:hypothetical protein L210DRAFT_1061587 [Boletus edulis BED1]